LDINDETKQIVQELGTAINSAVERSPEVANAIEKLREAGFELELTLKMEIGLRQLSSGDGVEEMVDLELTDEDMRTLRQMRIRIDDI
jgi:hypothetical protein